MGSITAHQDIDEEFPVPEPSGRPGDLRSWAKWLRARWIFISSGSRIMKSGVNNVVQLHDSLLHRCHIEMIGSNNRLEVMPGTRAWNVDFRIVGNGLHCRIGSFCRVHGGNFVVEDSGSRLLVGSGTTLYSPMIVAQEGGCIRIGEDCLIANGTDVRNSDSHSVLDATSRQRINPARDIQIANHVWIGTQAQILKGVTIGGGAIVAARSVVTKDVQPSTLVAGSPVRVLREGVDWDARRL